MIKLPVPKQLKIGPHEYTTSFNHEIRLKDSCSGYINYRLKTIELDPVEGQSERQVILLHEVIHGISEVFNVEISEPDTDRIANGLAMFLRDNFEVEFTFEGIDGHS